MNSKKKWKTAFGWSLGLLAAFIVFSGCLLPSAESRSERVSLDGSTSMEKVIGTLGEAFEQEQSETGFVYNPTGSTTGIQSVLEKRCDIGLSSRKLTDSEKEQGLRSAVLALDGIVLITGKDNPVHDLSSETIRKIYTGKITNWKEAGGSDQEIVLIGREAGSGTRDGFEEALGIKNKCLYRQELTSSGDIRNAVISNPAAVGYISLASLKDDVKALSVDGIVPSESSIQDGTYPVCRPFLMVVRRDEPLSEPAQKFMDFALSEREPHI